MSREKPASERTPAKMPAGVRAVASAGQERSAGPARIRGGLSGFRLLPFVAKGFGKAGAISLAVALAPAAMKWRDP